MIKPEPMQKLWIIGPKSVSRKTIEALYSLSCCHIKDHSKDENFDIGTPLENSSEVSEVLVRIRSIMSHLGLEPKEKEEKISFSQMDQRSKKIADQISPLLEEKRSSEARLHLLKAKEEKLSQIAINVPIEAFFSLSTLKGFIGILSKKEEEKVRPILLENASLLYESADHPKGKLVGIFTKSDETEKVLSLLQKSGFSPLDIRELEGLSGTPSEAKASIQKEIESIQKKLSKIESECLKISKEERSFLWASENLLSQQLLLAQAPLRFGESKELFLISGFVPVGKVEESISELKKATKEKIHIESSEIGADDAAPVKLKNPVPISSFESLLRLFSWPRYDEIDPSFLMIFTLPLFFGMMLGDIGYGVIALFIFLFLKRKFPIGAPFFNVLIISSISSIIFGFLFGEVFGLEEIAGHHLWHVLSRAHDINTLMYLTIALGVFHVNLGFLLGAYNEWKSHGFLTALTHKLSWVIVEIGVALLAAAYMVYPAIIGWKISAAIVLIIGLILLYKGEGFMGLIELPSLLSNIVSYTRIMAVGLASVFLAILVNEAVGALFAKGALYFIFLGIPLIIIGHGFNFALGVFSPFLHSVRLHYVEFFTKFYRGGGVEYAPFGKSKNA